MLSFQLIQPGAWRLSDGLNRVFHDGTFHLEMYMGKNVCSGNYIIINMYIVMLFIENYISKCPYLKIQAKFSFA